jgi:hypothetical protein
MKKICSVVLITMILCSFMIGCNNQCQCAMKDKSSSNQQMAQNNAQGPKNFGRNQNKDEHIEEKNKPRHSQQNENIPQRKTDRPLLDRQPQTNNNEQGLPKDNEQQIINNDLQQKGNQPSEKQNNK